MTIYRTLLLATAALALPMTAVAQTTPPEQTPPQTQPTAQPPAETPADADATEAEDDEDTESEVETVTVTADRAATRTSIDSVSYSLANDLQATTGSLADALRNIPSVDVDPNGNVSLRGDGNVTILIDGRPSALMSGPGRASVILQTPASQFSRIEVMTNPSAAYRPDGSGGIINLVSSPNAVRPNETRSGSLRANVGTEGRYNLGASGAVVLGDLTLTGDFGLRHDRQNFDVRRERERYDVGSGSWLDSLYLQEVDAPSDSQYLRLAAEYRVNEQVQLNGELRRSAFDSEGSGTITFEENDSLGMPAIAYRRDGFGGFSGEFTGATGRVLRQFGEDHDWTTELRFDRSDFQNGQEGATAYSLPALPGFYEVIDNDQGTDTWNFSTAYRRPMGEGRKLRLGYEAEVTSLDLANLVLRGATAATAIVDPTSTNDFQADQAVHAWYSTYERPIGPLTAQFGLRLEYVTRDLNQITQGITESNDYFRAYPTMHVEYGLSETQTLRGSYSRRVQRPQPEQLNPFVVYVDPDNRVSGNAGLLPQITDSFEVSWLSRANQQFFQATLYYRETSDAFTSVATDIGGGILLTRPENLGSSRSTGVELVANGRLHPTLRYNVSLNAFHQQIDATNLGFGNQVDGTTVSGRASLNWQPTPDDFFQLGGFWMGESVYAQGHREGRGMVNFGYRHKLNERLSLSFTVRDLFETMRGASYYETPTLRDRTENTFGGRSAFVGLTWTFGNTQGRPQQPQFDFGGGPQGTGPQ
ncbi:TonB-dependent receptor domain-containing protein [Brevundimonas aveniformis]|uniref:TonB-dependent receptor domain-containing protein n=1 Tax=Brevundimonas aveniformis TaxID=370977 RepID=UPI002492BC7F|nr:TonB-dependent receptor [Brevundimonas aveniformis]